MEYFLLKLDMVVILDFVVGVMENYGLVIYWEVVFLFDEKVLVVVNK